LTALSETIKLISFRDLILLNALRILSPVSISKLNTFVINEFRALFISASLRTPCEFVVAMEASSNVNAIGGTAS